MGGAEIESLFERGKEELTGGNTLSALSYFEKAFLKEKKGPVISYYAFCIAKERGQLQTAVEYCREAIEKEPSEPAHYLNMGRIYLLTNERTRAIDVFREGLHHEKEPEIISELDNLGTRKPPIIPFLKRSNFINKYLGIILSKMNLR